LLKQGSQCIKSNWPLKLANLVRRSPDMDKVLQDLPNSAKAHFAKAELLAKQGLFSQVGIELNWILPVFFDLGYWFNHMTGLSH
jgi:hypothetical protein